MKPKRKEKIDASMANVARVEKALEELATDLASATRESVELGDELRQRRMMNRLGDESDSDLDDLTQRHEVITEHQREVKELHDDMMARLETLRGERKQIEADNVLATVWQHNDQRNTLLERLDKAVDFLASIVDDIAKIERAAIADGARLSPLHRRTFTQVIADRIKSALQPYMDNEGWRSTMRMSVTPNERLRIDMGLRDQLLTEAQRTLKRMDAVPDEAEVVS